MRALEAWRREIRALIPRGFLRRDQGEGLLISDFPRWDDGEQIADRLRRAGYRVELRDGLAWLDGTEDKYAALIAAMSCPDPPAPEDALALWSLACRLKRAPASLGDQPRALLRLTLKYLDSGDFAGLYRALAPEIARLQRLGLPLPAAAGPWILTALAERKGGNPAC